MLYRILTIIVILFLIKSNHIMAQDFEFFEPKTTVGGYGELHYNNNKTENEEWEHTLDFHRFIIFVSHAWTERWSFRSELELEHNFVNESQGELALEQAFINYHHADYLGFQAGVILVGAGLINEFHEPVRFLGVERPEYSRILIPTTWFGNGIGVYGTISGFEYKAVVMEGLLSDNFSPSSGIRGGRQHGFEADAENLLYNVKVDYIGFPGLRTGASIVYNNAKGDSLNNEIVLAEFHAQYQAHNLYAVFEVGNISFGSGEIEAARGFYFDLGYNVGSLLNIESKIIPFLRYSDINTAAETKSGGDLEKMYHNTQWMLGISVLPIENVAIKFDYNEMTRELGTIKTKSYNLGFGYLF